MSAKENVPTGEWSETVARYVFTITTLFTILGITLVFLSSNVGLAFSGLRTGVAVSILYLIYKIAQEVHYFRKY